MTWVLTKGKRSLPLCALTSLCPLPQHLTNCSLIYATHPSLSRHMRSIHIPALCPSVLEDYCIVIFSCLIVNFLTPQEMITSRDGIPNALASGPDYRDDTWLCTDVVQVTRWKEKWHKQNPVTNWVPQGKQELWKIYRVRKSEN